MAIKHGHSTRSRKTPTYWSWWSMWCRVRSNDADKVAFYKGRGIGVCDRWLTFEPFLEDMGERPEGTTLDRIDNDRGYEPSNCRWATPKQQCRNRRSCHYIEVFGRRMTISEAAEVYGLPKTTIRSRLSSGWDAEPAVSTPRLRGPNARK